MDEALLIYEKYKAVHDHILNTNLLGEYDKAVTLYSLEQVMDNLIKTVRGKNIRYYEVSDIERRD